jgi:type II secretion system protein N
VTFATAERLRSLRGIAARVGFAVAVYLVAFYLSFPYARVKEQVIALAARRDLDVTIGSAGPLLGVGIAFHDIKVARRVPEGKKVQPLRIDEARVRISPLARLFGETAVNLAADLLGGSADVDWQATKTRSHLRVKTADLALAQIPGVKEAINIPLAGKLGLAMDLALPAGKMAETTGNLTWTCAGCALGDGKSKLKIAGVLDDGLDLPRVRLGDFAGKVVFEKGVGRLQGVQARSPDGEISLEGEIRLADPLPYSQIDLYLRFKLSDALLNGSDKLKMIMQLVESMGKGPDGSYGLKLTGTFARPQPPQWAKTSPFSNALPGRPAPPRRAAFAPARPNQDPVRAPSAELPHYPAPIPAEVRPLTPPSTPPTPAPAGPAAPTPGTTESVPPPRMMTPPTQPTPTEPATPAPVAPPAEPVPPPPPPPVPPPAQPAAPAQPPASE